jgi:hypothetical protein
MVELKYAAKPFFTMDDDEIDAFSAAILFKISVITGWQMPDNELHESELIEQLKKIFEEKYGRVNIQEVEYAFRHHLQPDWGKFFNLSMLSDVLDPYLSKRAEISQLEERIKSKPKELPAATEKLTDDEILDYTRKAYQATNNPLLIPKGVWRIVKTRIEFSEAERAEIRRLASLRVKQLFAKNPVDYKNENEQEWIDRVSKQLAVEKYFKLKK